MKEKFDAVKFQRMVREELSRKYILDSESFFRELEEKYGYLRKTKDRHALQREIGGRPRKQN